MWHSPAFSYDAPHGSKIAVKQFQKNLRACGRSLRIVVIPPCLYRQQTVHPQRCSRTGATITISINDHFKWLPCPHPSNLGIFKKIIYDSPSMTSKFSCSFKLTIDNLQYQSENGEENLLNQWTWCKNYLNWKCLLGVIKWILTWNCSRDFRFCSPTEPTTGRSSSGSARMYRSTRDLSGTGTQLYSVVVWKTPFSSFLDLTSFKPQFPANTFFYAFESESNQPCSSPFHSPPWSCTLLLEVFDPATILNNE